MGEGEGHAEHREESLGAGRFFAAAQNDRFHFPCSIPKNLLVKAVLVGVRHSHQGQAQGPLIPTIPPLVPTHAIASFQKPYP